MLISEDYEDTHTKVIYDDLNIQENFDETIHEWHLFDLDEDFIDRFLNDVFIILHAGETPVVNLAIPSLS